MRHIVRATKNLNYLTVDIVIVLFVYLLLVYNILARYLLFLIDQQNHCFQCFKCLSVYQNPEIVRQLPKNIDLLECIKEMNNLKIFMMGLSNNNTRANQMQMEMNHTPNVNNISRTSGIPNTPFSISMLSSPQNNIYNQRISVSKLNQNYIMNNEHPNNL